jgi:hypothetical protein
MANNGYTLLKIIEQYGQPATLRKLSTAGTYSTTTGAVTGSVTTDYAISAYFYNYNTGHVPRLGDVRRGDRRVAIPALGLAVEPDDEDLIVGVADTVSIVRVTTIFSAATKLVYLCDVSE